MNTKRKPTATHAAANGHAIAYGMHGTAATNAAAPIVRSEGQRMLLHVTGSLAAIAHEVGAKSPQSVLDWRNGHRQPNPAAKARMDAVFGIPRRAWSLLPSTVTNGAADLAADPANLATNATNPTESTTQLVAAAAEPTGPPPTTLEDCLQLLAVIRRDRNQPGLMAGERVKLADTEARILALRHRLEREAELSEDRLVREHPAWQRLKRLVVRALAKHPAAAKDVLAAMAAAGDGGEL